MKKTINKVICLEIIVLLLLSYIYPIISFANTLSYKTYLALGDSIAYGYGLSNKEQESYAAKVAQKYNISTSNFKNLAVSGMNCAEFYEQIQTSEYTQAIKSAELITISIGSNELLGIVTKAVSKVTGVPKDDPEFLEKVKGIFLNASGLKKITMLNTIYNYFTSEETKVEIENAIKSYGENWYKSIEYIKSQNTNVTIVATEFYNPYYEVSFASWDISGFVDEYIQKMNQILTSSSNSEKEYKIAKIYSAFNTTNPRMTNVNISTKNFNVDPHPNVLGHEIICTKILDALSSTTASKKDISTLTISNIPDQIYNGNAIEPEVTIKDGNTQLVKDKDFTVSYSNNTNVGEAKVTIVGIGNYSGNVMKTFNIKETERKDITEFTIKSIEDQIYAGIKITPDVEITDENYQLVKDKDYELNYSNNINVGISTITIVGTGNYKGTKDINFNIVAKDINLVNINDISDQKYTGQEIKPNIVMTDGSIKLVQDKDYTISYENNVNTGSASINISGKGNYKGTVTKQFNIIEETQDITKDISNTTITDIEDKTYTGKLITPEVRIKDGDNILIKNKDYTISYINNMNIGTGIAIITGIGDYSGRIEKSFNIVRKDIKYTMIADIEDQKYTGENITPKVVITSDYITLKEGQDYTVKYINNVEEGTATIQITGIGNYEGTMTKTFNIVKEVKAPIEDEKNNNNNDNIKDDTTANTSIPFSGMNIGILIAILVTFFFPVLFLTLYNKYKNIK